MSTTDAPDDSTAAARAELWRRHDAGEIDADEIEARLRALDVAGGDAGVAGALDGPVSIRRRLRSTRNRRRIGVALALAALVGGGAIAYAALPAAEGGSTVNQSRVVIGVGRVGPPRNLPAPIPAPIPTPVSPPSSGAVIVDVPEACAADPAAVTTIPPELCPDGG